MKEKKWLCTAALEKRAAFHTIILRYVHPNVTVLLKVYLLPQLREQ
jgi:hypothetical protein